MASGLSFKDMSPTAKKFLAAELILFAALAAYSNSLGAWFHFDDFHQIIRNVNIRSLEDIPRFFVRGDLASYNVALHGYRPVTYASFALSYAISGYHVLGYHIFNLSLHIINAILVFLIVRIIMDMPRSTGETLVPLAASLVFALHPVQTSAVTYISGRAVLLASFFTLLSFYSFLRFRACGQSRVRYMWLCLSPVLYLLGLLSKEMTVCLLPLIIAYDLVFTMRKMTRKAIFKAISVYLPFLAVLALYLMTRKALLGYASIPKAGYSTGDYFITQLRALMIYLRLLVFPINQNADYGILADGRIDAPVLVSAALVMAAFVLAFRIRKNNPAASFFILWFFIAHAPESSVFPIKDTVVEYRLYLSSIGLLAAVFAIIREKAAFPALQRAAAVCIIVVFGLLTVNRNTVWADDYSLWRDVVKQSPASVRAHTNLGRALLNGGRYQAAMSQFQTAEGLSPLPGDSYQLHNLRGQCLVGMGNARGAVSEFNAAINSAPRLAEAYANLGMAYYSAGRYAEAVKPLKEAVMLDPGHDTAHVNLALAYTMLGRHHDALLEMQAARMYMPKDFKVNYRLAAIYLNNGMKPEAREQAKNALRLADNDGQRASVLALLKRIGD